MGGPGDLMRQLADFAEQEREWRRGLKIYGAVAALGILILLASALFAAVLDIPGSILTREPQVTTGAAYYTGALSNLGALVWMAGVVMAIVGWLVTPEPPLRRAFLAGASVGAVLLIDDFFLVHDWVRDQNIVLDRVLLTVYMVLVVGLVVRYRTQLGPLVSAGIVASFLLLSLSAGLDFFFNALDQLVEDGFKFVGICIWSASWSLLALDRLEPLIGRSPSTSATSY